MIGDDNIVTATDFGHMEGKGYIHALDDILKLELPAGHQAQDHVGQRGAAVQPELGMLNSQARPATRFLTREGEQCM